MIQPSKKSTDRKDSTYKVNVKGGSEDTNTYYYEDPQATSTLSN